MSDIDTAAADSLKVLDPERRLESGHRADIVDRSKMTQLIGRPVNDHRLKSHPQPLVCYSKELVALS